ncbi:hypothetical protein BOO86_21500 [Mycobacterium sp. CBMA 234]|uniref:TniQ family protein n=1 Tax=Mycolicibacterium sp. CBMA 234 TaxID=1918495 RepID=UPI0012DEFE45|nr:TniQ family protein [Mycolicibacterium sp. CBMA 234]MUL67063.1 hypothetical protein [Mycolicibacterium sp. CBMA 234]
MTNVRTLPIRVAPLPGEAIDSWLEAVAARCHSVWCDVLDAVGLERGGGGVIVSPWVLQTLPHETISISDASCVKPSVVEAMTLSHYADRALRINTERRAINKAFPWGRASASRYCPQCLAETGGRWQLKWRLGWSFACLTHNCLLADTCPSCRELQRRRPLSVDMIPVPGTCAGAAAGAAGRAAPRCGADLTATAVTSFPAEHAVIEGQRIVYDIIDSGVGQFGIYKDSPQPVLGVLSDIRALAGRVLAYADDQELADRVAPDLLAAYRAVPIDSVKQTNPRVKPGLAAPATAQATAVGVTAALTTLNQLDVTSAGRSMRWMVDSGRSRGLDVNPSTIGWGRSITPTLTAVQLAALDHQLQPSRQLRYRTATPSPRRPQTDSEYSDQLLRSVPTMFWPAWSLHLAVPNCEQRVYRSAQSAALLLVGTKLTIRAAGRLLDAPAGGSAISRVLGLMQDGDWNATCAVLTTLADYLVETGSPIDYQRRRKLDYADLLPDDVWKRICRETATPGRGTARARIVRGYLFEQLSTLPASAAPFTVDSYEFRSKTADFPRSLTPELLTALNEHCMIFLASNGIGDEPLTWHPPATIIDNLVLPGDDPQRDRINDLHRLVRIEDGALGDVANALNTTLDTVRYLLGRTPAPADDAPIGGPARRRFSSYRRARSALPPHRFSELYVEQKHGLGYISELVGADRKAVAQLAAEYGIALRPHGRLALVDRDWLYEQYVKRERPMTDLARDCDVGVTTMTRWAVSYGIPLRTRGPSPSYLRRTAAAAATGAPEVLQPAFVTPGAWDRLYRFADAAGFQTLTEAAECLDLPQFVLVRQINRLEHDFGTKLLNRALRGQPMTLTQHGECVVRAVRQYRKDHPDEDDQTASQAR